MIVVGIMGILMTTGVPIVYRAWKKAPMAKAISEVVEVCSNARAQAIMQGRQVDLVFYPTQGRFAVGAAPVRAPAGPARPAPGSEAAMAAGVSLPGSGNSGQLPESIIIEMLDINKLKHDFRLDETARVRFFPNGTSDELTLILLSEKNERCEILLEVTTGLAEVEWDPNKFR
jgi:type II secretory pathway pseudopilin PulG